MALKKHFDHNTVETQLAAFSKNEAKKAAPKAPASPLDAEVDASADDNSDVASERQNGRKAVESVEDAIEEGEVESRQATASLHQKANANRSKSTAPKAKPPKKARAQTKRRGVEDQPASVPTKKARAKRAEFEASKSDSSSDSDAPSYSVAAPASASGVKTVADAQQSRAAIVNELLELNATHQKRFAAFCNDLSTYRAELARLVAQYHHDVDQLLEKLVCSCCMLVHAKQPSLARRHYLPATITDAVGVFTFMTLFLIQRFV